MGLLQKTASVAAAALALSTTAHAEAIQYCPESGVCFSVAVPTSSASSGSGNIYFQISAPTSYSWVSLGSGSRMAGSNLFLMYEDGKGNVTISNRQASGYTNPSVKTGSEASDLTLLAGSGVDGNTMTANVRCGNCQSWSGGSLDFSSQSAPWVAAWKGGNSLDSTSVSQSISLHDDTSTFGLDLTRSTIESDENPFVGSASSSDSSGSSGSGGSSSGASDNEVGVSVNGGGASSLSIVLAHGFILSIVMIALYPIGSMLQILLKKWAVHASVQMLGFVLMWIGFGLGVKAADERMMLFKNPHTILGTVIICLFGIQPVLGWAHHRHFVKHQARGAVSHVHIWYGRVLMVIGIINGGTGLALAGTKGAPVIAYGVIAGIHIAVYIGLIAWRIACPAVTKEGREVQFQRRPYAGSS